MQPLLFYVRPPIEAQKSRQTGRYVGMTVWMKLRVSKGYYSVPELGRIAIGYLICVQFLRLDMDASGLCAYVKRFALSFPLLFMPHGDIREMHTGNAADGNGQRNAGHFDAVSFCAGGIAGQSRHHHPLHGRQWDSAC